MYTSIYYIYIYVFIEVPKGIETISNTFYKGNYRCVSIYFGVTIINIAPSSYQAGDPSPQAIADPCVGRL